MGFCIPKTQVSPGQTLRDDLPGAEVQSVVWLDPTSRACFYRLILGGRDGHQRLLGWGTASLRSLIGQPHQRRLCQALLHSKAGQIKEPWQVGFLGSPISDHLIVTLAVTAEGLTWQDCHSQGSGGGHQRVSSKGQGAAWGPFGHWPLVGREERTGETPKENVWSRITTGKLLQARNLTLAFVFLPWNHEIWLPHVA